ncbi:hypothetical protein BaRGS_00025946 [Batillaria attramentaria]|uniref:Uncharacterized protein n=1 Tax=Batillaria attramentaria TaxID=370345 RepID=A0ABD0K5V3_9CAEN
MPGSDRRGCGAGQFPHSETPPRFSAASRPLLYGASLLRGLFRDRPPPAGLSRSSNEAPQPPPRIRLVSNPLPACSGVTGEGAKVGRWWQGGGDRRGLHGIWCRREWVEEGQLREDEGPNKNQQQVSKLLLLAPGHKPW